MVMHRRRRWGVSTCTREELSERLATQNCTLCAAFQTPGGTVWANDSTGEEALQEYAVLRRLGEEWKQIESITVSWCTPDRLLAFAIAADAGNWDGLGGCYRSLPASALDIEDHPECPLCM